MRTVTIDALHAMRRTWTSWGITVVIIGSWYTLSDFSAGITVSAFMYPVLSLIAHRALLHSASDTTDDRHWPFLWRFLLFAAFGAIQWGLFIWILNRIGMPDLPFFSVNDVIILGFLIAGCTHLLFLARRGTALPAAVEQADATFATARTRSRGRTWKIFWQLLSASGLWLAMAVAINTAFAALLPSRLAVIATNYIGEMATCLFIYMFATILCRAYHAAEDSRNIEDVFT